MNRAPFPPIPEDTANAARAIFGRNNFYVSVGDHTSELFSDLFPFDPPNDVMPSTLTLPVLYLITIFQYFETLPDQRAADAVRERVDWKYGLHLPLHFPGIEASALCKFRRSLLADPARLDNLHTLVQRLYGFSPQSRIQVSQEDAAQIVNHLCLLRRISDIWEVMSQALGSVVTKYPQWLRLISMPHWYARYSTSRNQWEERFEKPDWEAFVLSIGSDGIYLLGAISEAKIPELAELPQIRSLKQVWLEQYEWVEGRLIWRTEACAYCSPPYRT